MDERDLEKSSSRSLAELLALAFDEQGPAEQQLGEYRLLQKLGEGGMGTVYKALHTELDRLVALKVLRPGLIDPQEASARFRREIKVAGQLDHPHIVRAHDARKLGETHFLVMEYVDGVDFQTLSDRRGPLPSADACELIRQAALGLQCAHEYGMVHRDIKPSNLMLSRGGQVKILDLGLARLAGLAASGHQVTMAGQVMGTPDYIAPEQVHDSRQADIRSDIYSLGCTFFKLLTGRAPFGGSEYTSVWSKLSAHLERPFPPLRRCRADVPRGLAAVLERMVSKDPAARFASPVEVAETLAPFATGCDLPQLFLRSEDGKPDVEVPRGLADTAVAATAGTPPSPSPLPSPLPLPRPKLRRRTRRWPWPAAAVLLALAAGVIWYVGGGSDDPPHAATGEQTVAEKESPPVRPAIPRSAARREWIVLSWSPPRMGRPHLWLLRPSGAQRQRITHDPQYFDIHPKFSPDGRQIAFIRGSEPGRPNALWVCNTNGENCRQIVAGEGKSERLFSPVWISKSRIYYVRDPVYNRAPDLEVWAVDLDRSEPERVFRFAEVFGEGSGVVTDVSPDRRQLAVIAATTARPAAADVWVCDLQGGSARKIWSDPKDDCQDGRALWSPDGRHLAWHHNFPPVEKPSERYYGVGLATFQADGTWTTRIQPDPKPQITPLAWSPHGEELLCARSDELRQRVSVVRFFLMNTEFVPKPVLFKLGASFWQPGQRDLGRLADWAVVPDDAAPK